MISFETSTDPDLMLLGKVLAELRAHAERCNADLVLGALLKANASPDGEAFGSGCESSGSARWDGVAARVGTASAPKGSRPVEILSGQAVAACTWLRLIGLTLYLASVQMVVRGAATLTEKETRTVPACRSVASTIPAPSRSRSLTVMPRRLATSRRSA